MVISVSFFSDNHPLFYYIEIVIKSYQGQWSFNALHGTRTAENVVLDNCTAFDLNLDLNLTLRE